MKPKTTTTAKASFYTSCGRFNIASTEKEWLLGLDVTLPTGERVILDETFGDRADEPDPACPSEAFEMIEERQKSYWLDTSKEAKESKRNKIRPFLPLLDYVWATKRAAELRREADELEQNHPRP